MRIPKIVLVIGCLFSLGFALFSCEKEETATDTFALIQRDILTPSCATAGCHASTSDPSFAQHELVLAAGVAYSNLVGASPKNSNAKQDGLLRVTKNNADKSLLYHKLLLNPDHHNGKNYGNPMPLGDRALTNGQIQLIKNWIEGGAPEKGAIVTETVLKDTTRQVPYFQALPKPAAGQGTQVRIDPFEVSPKFEREFFVYKSLENSEPLYVNRIEISMRSNSHHFLMYQFAQNTPPTVIPQENKIRDLRSPNGTVNIETLISMGYHVYLAGTQTPYSNYRFPEGTALLIPANFKADFNSHYVNKTDKILYGEVYMNLYTTPAASVKKVVKTLNLGNNSLPLPPNTRTTHTKNFTMNKKTYLISLTSHTHKFGEKFIVRIRGGKRNGEIIYTATDWEHPEIVNFSEPIVLNAGEGLTSEITYNNTSARQVSFGLTSEDEMGIIFGYYYEE